MNFSKKSKIIIFTAFAVVLIFYMVFISIGAIFSKYSDSKDIENAINKNTDLIFNLDDFKLKTTPDLSIEICLKNLLVTAPDTKKKLVNLENTTVKFKALPLIFKRLNLKKISSDKIFADILMDENGRFEFEKYFNKGFTPDFKVNLSGTDVNIKKYSVKFEDKMYFITHKIEGEGLFSDKISNKNINFKTKADIYSNNNKTIVTADISTKLPVMNHIDDKDFMFDFKANNINLKTLYPYFKQFNIKNSGGIINLDISTIKEKDKNKINIFSKIDNLFIENHKSTVKNDDTIVIKTNTYFDGKTMEFEDFRLVSNEIDINSKGTIKNYLSKNPKPDLDVEIKNTELNSLIALVPDELENPDISISNLKKHNAHAKLNGLINISDNVTEPEITGNIDFKDVYVITLDKRIPFAYGSAELLKTHAKIDVMAFARPNQWVEVEGDFNLYGDRSGKFKVKSAPDVDLAVARPILFAVRDVLNFILGPLPLMDIKGKGSIDIFVEGTKQDALIDGWFKFKDTSATIQGLNCWIENADGTLIFNREDMTFDNWKGKISGSPVTVNGTATTQGSVDINFIVDKAKFADLISIGNKTDYLKDLKEFMPTKPIGYADFKLNLKGRGLKKNFTQDTIINELKPSGSINFENCGFTYLNNILVKNLNGKAEYGDNSEVDLSGFLHNSEFSIKGRINQKNNKSMDMNISLSSNGIRSDDIFKSFFGYDPNNRFVKNAGFTLAGNVNAKGEIPSDISEFNLEKLNLTGEIKGVNDKKDNIKIPDGKIILNGKDAVFQGLNLEYLNSKIQVDGSVQVLAKKPKPNLKVQLYNLKFATILEALKLFEVKSAQNILSDFSDPKGSLKGAFEIHGDNFKGKIEPYNVSIFSNSKKAFYVLKSGDIEFNNKNLKLKAFNFDLGDVPFFIDTTITNFATKNPLFNAKFSTIIDEKGTDKHINSMLSYPVKVQGEVGVKGKISGLKNKYNINSTLTLNPNSDISYMGANIGDVDSKREINTNISFADNIAKIHKVELLKYISSQNNKTYPISMIRMSGNAHKKEKNFTLEPLVIKTSNPVNAKFFNVYFKKSILKQGLFNCDMKITGDINTPKITGNLDFKDINIPLYDLKILNADINLNNDDVIVSIDGRSSDSDVKVKLVAQNNIAPPFVIHKINVNSKVINLMALINKITETVQNKGFEINSGDKVALTQDTFVIEEGKINAEEVKLNNISAKNFSSSYSQGRDGILKIKDMVFDIAGGKIISNGELSLGNASANLKSEIKHCDANTLAHEFLGMQNQIQGDMNGKISFSGSKLYLKEGINTIKSKVNFEILNGKMPKLGSLEYLLRAANIYKNGILGFSLNSIIELIIPYKTGEFESIKGNFNIEDGLVKDIEVYSKGKNLSIFIEGSYDINTKNTDLIIFGRLAKNVSNVLGFVGNTSFNSLINMFSSKKFKIFENDVVQAINKIPLIEISGDDYRIFTARILGDINKDNYVKSFNWLN